MKLLCLPSPFPLGEFNQILALILPNIQVFAVIELIFFLHLAIKHQNSIISHCPPQDQALCFLQGNKQVNNSRLLQTTQLHFHSKLSLKISYLCQLLHLITAMPQRTGLSFLDLPAEIRLQIYCYLIPQHQIYNLAESDDSLWKAYTTSVKTPLIAVPALFRSNSTCYKEAAPRLYARNAFTFLEFRNLARWIERIGTRNAACIRTVHVDAGVPFTNCELRQFFQICRQLSGIRSLLIWYLGPEINDGGNRDPWKVEAVWFARTVIKRMPWLTRLLNARHYGTTTIIRFAAQLDDGSGMLGLEVSFH